MEEKTHEQIQQEIDLELEKEKVRAKAEAETREVSTIVKDTSQAIQVKLNERALKQIDMSPEIDKKIEETTNSLVDMGLDTQKNKVEAEFNKSKQDKAKTEFNLAEDQYRAFGQDTSPQENWKKKLIKYGYNFWFCVITFICFFSLAPVYIFLKVIKTQTGVLKWFAIVVGVLLGLGILAALTYGVLKWTGAIM